MTRLWALVPLKQLAGVKTRLAAALDGAARRELALAMAKDVATAMAGARTVERVVLVSDIPDLPRLLGVPGVTTQVSTAAGGLNQDLGAAAGWAAHRGASHVLIAHADLPLLTPEAIDGFVGAPCPRGLRAAACRHGTGTNLLLAPVPLPLPLVFGRDSLARFREESVLAGRTLQVVREPLLAADIDDVADYEGLLALSARDARWSTATARLLRTTTRLLAPSHA